MTFADTLSMVRVGQAYSGTVLKFWDMYYVCLTYSVGSFHNEYFSPHYGISLAFAATSFRLLALLQIETRSRVDLIGEGERRRWFDFGPDEKPTSHDHSLHLDVRPTLYRVTHLDHLGCFPAETMQLSPSLT